MYLAEHFPGESGERHLRSFGIARSIFGRPGPLSATPGLFAHFVNSNDVIHLHDRVTHRESYIALDESALGKQRQFPHAGHHSVVRCTLFKQDFNACVAIADREKAGDFAAGHGSAFGSFVFAKGAAFCFPWTYEALRIARCADGSAEFHDGLVEVAGAMLVDERCREFFNFAADDGFTDARRAIPNRECD